MEIKPGINLQTENFYLLRRPLLPIQHIFSLNEETLKDEQLFEQRVLECYQDPLLQEAIYTASPELYKEFKKLIEKGSEEKSKNKKIIVTLYKYLIRMSTRCTPYGLFAGCTAGVLANDTSIGFSDKGMNKHSRLDMNYVCELVNHLLLTTPLKEQLSFYSNNSLYKIGDSYRYIEYKLGNKRRKYVIASVKQSGYLAPLLRAANAGLQYKDIVGMVMAMEPEASASEAKNFVDQLISSQLLVSELEPTITGDIFFDSLPEKLKGKVPAETVDTVREIQACLSHGDVKNFKKIYRIINTLFGKSSSKDLIQTDLFLEPDSNVLSKTVTSKLSAQLSSLFTLSNKTNLPNLERFKKDFYERFEEREVPLLLALDSETGIGYGSLKSGSGDHLPLLEGITPTKERKAMSVSWDNYTRLVNEVHQRASVSAATEVELTDTDLSKLDAKPELGKHAPSSLYAFGSLVASTSESLDAGEFTFLLASCAGPSVANLLGRFCYGDSKLYESTKVAIKEAEPDTEDAVFAEVVHLPEARVGNILMRPRLRQYEIPFLGVSSASPEDQIPVQDLLISVKHGKIVLRSKRLNKRVIPRLSTAHNYSTGLPIYRFLCDLQKDGQYSGIHWSWENLRQEAFLPRVRYKNIVLAKACWSITSKDIALSVKPAQGEELLVRELLRQRRVPRHVCLTEHDNELLIDTAHSASLQVLIHQLRKKGKVKLTEFLLSPDQCFISGKGKDRYVNEFLFPVTNTSAAPQRKTMRPQPINKTQRSFPPGSEWVYFKLYGGTKSVDKVLTEKLRPLLLEFLEEGLISHWFFIRYTDPLHHLRVRMHVPAERRGETALLMNRMYTALREDLEEDLIHKVQIDTYVRELERYGELNIEHSEALFYQDSQSTVNVLNMLEGDEGNELRYLLAFRGLHELLNDFGLGLDGKKEFMQTLAAMFFEEFNGDKLLRVQLNNKYRKEAAKIRSFLNADEDTANGIEEATLEFNIRSQRTQEVIGKIGKLFTHGFSAASPGFSLLASYVHMYMNRFFLSKPRQHELVLYNLLHKHYTSQAAMQKKIEYSL